VGSIILAALASEELAYYREREKVDEFREINGI